jgi:hypothetical protein
VVSFPEMRQNIHPGDLEGMNGSHQIFMCESMGNVLLGRLRAVMSRYGATLAGCLGSLCLAAR